MHKVGREREREREFLCEHNKRHRTVKLYTYSPLYRLQDRITDARSDSNGSNWYLDNMWVGR